jgi:S-methyl-5-thioribose-1-phosphate isomerase
MDHLQSVRFIDGKLSVIDQLKLPNQLVYMDVNNKEDAWKVIRDMNVRGAPLIAIVAALGMAVDVAAKKAEIGHSSDMVSEYILEGTKYLRTSRPTAAPLFNIMDKLDAFVVAQKLALDGGSLIDSFVKEAENELKFDIEFNRSMASHGADYIVNLCKGRKQLRVLTICNTGSLATGGYGTALGVIRMLHERGALEHVYACETRPYNQGARLTAFEITHDKLPGTLIPDSSASALMAVKGIDVVIVGGDRVAANGGM